MLLPGAMNFTTLPKLLYEAKVLFEFSAETQITLGSPAGVKPLASALLLPAATQQMMPAAVALAIASDSPWLKPLAPKLMLPTRMLSTVCLPMAQLMPATMPENEPLPLRSSTLTAIRLHFGATPTTPMPLSRAPMMPAQWLPWP